MTAMATAPLLALGIFHVVGAAADPTSTTAAFVAFVEKYGRQYESKEEEERRYAIFKEKYDFVQAENAKDLPYKLTINEFADQSHEEFGAHRLGLRVPESKELWGGLPHLGTDRYSGAALPDAVDWTEEGAVTEVKNQKRCGSCWSFSTTGAVEGAWKLASGKLVSLSEQQLVDCSKSNHGCHGGSMELAFRFLHTTAICTEDSYPYTAKDGTCKQNVCTPGVPKGSLTGFKDVPPNDELALKEAVSKQPVSVAIEADEMAFQLYHGGVLTKQCGVKLDHGVLVVGYGSENGVDYWKVKNSWGASWGESGYIRLERGNSSKKSGQCGINLDASYPVMSAVPGPSPSPPGPSPPPAPAASHYEKPPCQSEEVEARIRGADGVLCAPPCDDQETCPTDVPAGTTAQPQCVLKSPDGSQYCALLCLETTECPTGSSCVQVGGNGAGLCLYPDEVASQGLPAFFADVAFSASAKENMVLV